MAETNRIKAWKNNKLAARFLGSLRGSDFALYRDQGRALDLADNTIRLSLSIISNLFNIASKEWGIEGLKNSIESIRMPKGSKPRDRRIETVGVPNLFNGEIEQKSEIELILETSHSKELKLFIKLALETAMRRSEIAQLEWAEIDLENRTAYLPDTKPGESREVPL